MANIICLPKLSIKYPYTLPQNQLLLVGGGREPDEKWLLEAAKGRNLWCIDHGMDICHRLGLMPELVLGDFDSCSPDSLQWAQSNGAEIEKFNPQKDFTDTQAALQRVNDSDTFCILTGALGKRFDHTYSTVFTFGNTSIKGCIADEQEAVFFLHGNEAITLSTDFSPKAISLLPISQSVAGVTTQGLFWELNNADLFQNKPYAVSNVLSEKKNTNTFTISIKKGILAVYLLQKE
ncbi:thiamine diphosphokinase [uncultured Anaerovibrio sp.]|uniref:thiamine diphosphokinase n=1 Tax=uncultured Anaerovibrio sp. TaxID=361586 RepID=UPI00260260A5|nr:thiamine diphosphokinase [uncultured Anaerovibrio sp.]